MKVRAPSLAPLLRSNAQGDILALLLLNPDGEFSLSDIAREVGALPATVHREVERLVVSGTLTDRTIGRSRMIRANTGHELYRPLAEIIMATYGPRAVLPGLFEGVDGVESAFLFGSWAARYHGESGPPPRDIDVAVVGNPTRAALADVARQAEQMMRREVNIARIAPVDWADSSTPFVATLKSRPRVALVGNE